jgi:hypothetical protein
VFARDNIWRKIKRTLINEDADFLVANERKGAGTRTSSESAFSRTILVQSPNLSEKDVEYLATKNKAMILLVVLNTANGSMGVQTGSWRLGDWRHTFTNANGLLSMNINVAASTIGFRNQTENCFPILWVV